MHVRFAGRNLGSFLKFGDGFGGFAESIKSLTNKNVSRSGVGLALLNLPEAIQCTWVVAGPQAALCEEVLQFAIFWVDFGGNFEVLRCVGKLFVAVVAHSQ